MTFKLLPEDIFDEFAQILQNCRKIPQLNQFVSQASAGKLPTKESFERAKAAPKISKEKLLSVIEIRLALIIEAMEDQRPKKLGQPTQDEAETDRINALVEKAKIDDSLFHREGVDFEEYDQAKDHYLHIKDPEVSNAIKMSQTETFKRIQVGLKK